MVLQLSAVFLVASSIFLDGSGCSQTGSPLARLETALELSSAPPPEPSIVHEVLIADDGESRVSFALDADEQLCKVARQERECGNFTVVSISSYRDLPNIISSPIVVGADSECRVEIRFDVIPTGAFGEGMGENLAGRLWIDPATESITEVRLSSIKPFKKGAGLMRLDEYEEVWRYDASELGLPLVQSFKMNFKGRVAFRKVSSGLSVTYQREPIDVSDK